MHVLTSWAEIAALLKGSRFTGAVILHCAEGEPKDLEIPPVSARSQHLKIALDRRGALCEGESMIPR